VEEKDREKMKKGREREGGRERKSGGERRRMKD
jgi:hypothetical protein